MSENKTEEKKFLLKQRKALWWNVADKPGVKSGDEAILDWFRIPNNASRYLNGKRHPKFGENLKSVLNEIKTTVNENSSPPRSPSAVAKRLREWVREFKKAKTTADSGASEHAVRQVFPYYYDLVDCMTASQLPTTIEKFTTQQKRLSTSTSSSISQRSKRSNAGYKRPRGLSSSCSPSPPSPSPSSSSSSSRLPKKRNIQSDHDQDIQEQEEKHHQEASVQDTPDILHLYLQQSNEQMLRVCKAQEMQAQANLIQSMNEAGFSKEEIWATINQHHSA